jgi:hypothetical protein
MATVTSIDTAQQGMGRGGRTSLVSFLRPANATPYTAGDVINDANDEAKALIFPGCGRNGLIHQARIVVAETDTISFELYVFDAEPTGVMDNAALSIVANDMDSLLAVFTYADADKITMVTGINTYVTPADEKASFPVPYASANGNLYGHLVCRTGYTPLSGAKFWIRLGVELS